MKYANAISECKAVSVAIDAVKRGRLSHAYLISCEDEYTSRVAGALLVSNIIGTEDVQRVYGDAFVDIISYPGEGKDKILKDDVNNLTSTADITPTELPYKFYIIRKAETMNDAAQNKLLKTLEEAPKSVIIVLEAATTLTLLPTVLSRCVKIDIPPFDLKKIEEEMELSYGADERIYPAVALSKGYFGLAERVIIDKVFYEAFKLALETLVFMKTSRNILSYSAKWTAKKENVPLYIDCLSAILGDCLVCSVGNRENIKLKSNVKEIIELSKLYDYRVCPELIPILSEAKRKLGFNCNVQPVVDGLLFSILEVKAKCQKSWE